MKRIILKKTLGKANQHGRKYRYTIKCLICGDSFEIGSYRYKQGGGYICGNKCKSEWHSKRMKGKIPWIKGKTKEDYPQLISNLKGKEFTQEHKDNLSKAHKGQKGYWKGKKFSKEHSENMSRVRKGKRVSVKSEFKKGQIAHNKGQKMSEEQKKKLSLSHIGNPGYWEGKIRHNMLGDKHPMWQGGISNEPYPYEFTERLKSKIRKRDGYKCQKCNKDEKDEYIGKLKCKLSIHHIDYNKDNCKEENLITLCRGCNNSVNANRPHWTEYFKNKTKPQLIN